MEATQAARIDPREFRQTLGHFATGVIIMEAKVKAQVYGMPAHAFRPVLLDPPPVLISVDHPKFCSNQIHVEIAKTSRRLEFRVKPASGRFNTANPKFIFHITV